MGAAAATGDTPHRAAAGAAAAAEGGGASPNMGDCCSRWLAAGAAGAAPYDVMLGVAVKEDDPDRNDPPKGSDE